MSIRPQPHKVKQSTTKPRTQPAPRGFKLSRVAPAYPTFYPSAMIKLYKREPGGAVSAYHEVWAEPRNRRLIEHWGPLGEKGETRAHRAKILRPLEAQFDDLLAAPRQAGYAEVDIEDHSVLLVEYAVDGFGTEDDLEKRHALEDLLHEVLGWTGLGECDGGSIGSNTMEAACFVVDFPLAKAVIAEALQDTPFADYSRIYREE